MGVLGCFRMYESIQVLYRSSSVRVTYLGGTTSIYLGSCSYEAGWMYLGTYRYKLACGAQFTMYIHSTTLKFLREYQKASPCQ